MLLQDQARIRAAELYDRRRGSYADGMASRSKEATLEITLLVLLILLVLITVVTFLT